MTVVKEFRSDAANVQLGDVTLAGSFALTTFTPDGRHTLTATVKAPKGKKFMIMLLAEVDKDDNPLDFDIEGALAELGFIPGATEQPTSEDDAEGGE